MNLARRSDMHVAHAAIDVEPLRTHARRAGRRAVRLVLGALLILGTTFVSGVSAAVTGPALSVEITSAPPHPSISQSAHFDFRSSEPASFTCSLDGGPASPCSSPASYAGLAEGAHVFVVSAQNVDRAGRTYTAHDTYRWAIDLPDLAPPSPPSPPQSPQPVPPTPLPQVQPSPQLLVDSDGDGVDDLADRCGSTPKQAKQVALGCSAVDVVAGAARLVEPVAANVEEASGWLGKKHASFRVLSRDLGRSVDLLEDGAALVEGGSLCKGAALYGKSLALLRRVHAELPPVVDRIGAELLREARAVRNSGDADEGEAKVAGLEIGVSRVEWALDAAVETSRAFGAACAAVEGALDRRGRVTGVDDAARLVELDRRFVLVRAAGTWRRPFAEGAVLRAKGKRFKDGTALLEAAEILPGVSLKTPVKAKCIWLKIAPIQPFAPYAVGQYTLHHPDGYKVGASGFLRLESGMRLGAEATCPTAGQAGTTLFFFLKVDVGQGSQTETVATALSPGDVPVPVPGFVVANEPVTITATSFVQGCKLLANGFNICDNPVQTATETRSAYVNPRGSYATAGYDKTAFILQDGAFTWEPAVVTGVSSVHTAGTNPMFKARGYGVHQGSSTHPVAEEIQQGEQFAVYPQAFADPDAFDYVEQTGTSHHAGLKWPHLEGIRNGRPYWFSVKLPQIVTDALARCASPPHTFYKLPFDDDPDWELWNGNYDDPIHGHPDTGLNTGNNQKYAFDFGHDSNDNNIGEELQNVRAARPGTVYAVVAAEVGNSADTFWTELFGEVDGPVPPGYTGVGNFVVLRHQDGTFGSYWHLYPNSVTVSPGDEVARGQVLAQVGNTGSSSTPHLHFDSRSGWDLGYPGNWVEFPSVAVRFHDKNHTNGCWLPRVGEALASNNS